MDNNQERKFYVEIDIVAASELLAEDAWEEMVGKNPQEHLWETVVDVYGNTKRQITKEWTYEFFTMKRSYLSLLNSYAKVPLQEHEIDQL